MASQITGSEFQAFHQHLRATVQLPHNPDVLFSGCKVSVDGEAGVDVQTLRDQYGERLETLPKDALISLHAGVLAVPTFLKLRQVLLQWRKERDTVSIVAMLEVPRADAAALLRAQQTLEDLGASVRRSDEAPGERKPRSPRP